MIEVTEIGRGIIGEAMIETEEEKEAEIEKGTGIETEIEIEEEEDIQMIKIEGTEIEKGDSERKENEKK